MSNTVHAADLQQTPHDPTPAEDPVLRASSDSAGDSELVQLRTDILAHIGSLGLNGTGSEQLSKEAIRRSHAQQRAQLLSAELKALEKRVPRLLNSFANGAELTPDAIEPELIQVRSGTVDGDLFRLASLLWSVPVSRGYGRRMRYLVRDKQNGKLIGLFGLGDPVFNLRARDEWIGWDTNDRRARLVNVMDAYVVGAVPPYSMLLGGKLVTALLGSIEVSKAFAARYGGTRGIISGQAKGARLAMITVTSALGRSSIYNRVKLWGPQENESKDPLVDLIRVGHTRGFGHFQLSEMLFSRMRQLIAREGHLYANGHQFGNGPNWRIRVIRVALQKLGLSGDLLRHGIEREVFAMPLAPNAKAFLRGEEISLADQDRPTVDEISSAAVTRWVIPRANSRNDFSSFERNELLAILGRPIQPDFTL